MKQIIILNGDDHEKHMTFFHRLSTKAERGCISIEANQSNDLQIMKSLSYNFIAFMNSSPEFIQKISKSIRKGTPDYQHHLIPDLLFFTDRKYLCGDLESVSYDTLLNTERTILYRFKDNKVEFRYLRPFEIISEYRNDIGRMFSSGMPDFYRNSAISGGYHSGQHSRHNELKNVAGEIMDALMNHKEFDIQTGKSVIPPIDPEALHTANALLRRPIKFESKKVSKRIKKLRYHYTRLANILKSFN